MKKIFTIILTVTALSYSATAQFHLELGSNFNSPSGSFGDIYDLGVGAYIEPKFALTENIDLGLYLGANGFAGADIAGTSGSVDAASITPILGTATYRFFSSSVTPYAGLGIGIYSGKIAGVAVGGTSVSTVETSTSEFGFAPRAGVYLGRLNLGVTYNKAGDIEFIQFSLGARIRGRG